MEVVRYRLLIVGDDTFTASPCILGNIVQWKSKCNTSESSIWDAEVASALPENKIPFAYRGNHDRLVSNGIKIHYNVNPALLRQYFTTDDDSNTGPPYDMVLYILPGLQYEGSPRFIEKTSDLFQLRLHLFWFSLAKSATVITKPSGAIMILWIDQDRTLSDSTPFPFLDIHKLGPFCKIRRSESEDFRLNLSWGDYKTDWKPLVHNFESMHFPTFLEELKIYVFRNLPTEASEVPANSEEYNLLRIPQSICRWSRTVLAHVNELFHFNMRTCIPGEMFQVSKLSVKYDPRINGWRNVPQSTPSAEVPNLCPPPQAAPTYNLPAVVVVPKPIATAPPVVPQVALGSWFDSTLEDLPQPIYPPRSLDLDVGPWFESSQQTWRLLHKPSQA